MGQGDKKLPARLKRGAEFSAAFNAPKDSFSNIKQLMGMQPAEKLNNDIPDVQGDVDNYNNAMQKMREQSQPVEQKQKFTDKELDSLYNEFQPAPVDPKIEALKKLRGF
jgi:hypothetical protein